MAQAVDESKSAETSVIIVLTNANETKDKDGKVHGRTGWYLPEVAHPYYIFKKAGYNMTFASIKGGDCEMDFGSYEIFALSDNKDQQCVDFVELMRASDANETDVSNDKADAVVKGTIGRDETGDAKDRKINKLFLSSVPITSLQGHETEYDIIFFAGGHGTAYDFYDSNPKHDTAGKKDTRTMHSVAAKIYENEQKPGIVSAVCHGVVALVDLTLSDGTVLVKDKTVCGFTDKEEDAANMTDYVPVSLEKLLKENGCKWDGKDNWANNSVADSRVVTGQNPQSAGSAATLCVEELKKLRS